MERFQSRAGSLAGLQINLISHGRDVISERRRVRDERFNMPTSGMVAPVLRSQTRGEPDSLVSEKHL